MDQQKFAETAIAAFEAQGIGVVAGVPDGLFTGLIEALCAHSTIHYVACAREEECLGVAAGALMAGQKAAVIIQNAGLLNSLGAYATLLDRYRLPVPILVAHRGGLFDRKAYDIEKYRATEALDGDYYRCFRTTHSDLSEKTVSAFIDWCRVASQPALLLIEKGEADGQ
ncbi:thiamine pyrophosphate-binding protein [Notoacmeibacter sp. MSK16QG-6]|uniref:thiamine pyrophosphate-binding protein n=1 Tax=Notoacmeibacter sp. MSK16QG-6 TaxID=2957982 RepID=UPI0020A05815|nr:thiamine pyrophosphate-binding protein [Notoacmeibacter sp. MSK16QG-6]MCP1199167.1 thiamine pyrophosphate-binding protein [Notoacmeibacter sp. MSK16QG-6]